MKTIKVNDNHIAYKQFGEGQPLVLLHGFCGSMSYWENVAEDLSMGYQVILIDLRGHGASSSSTYPFSIDDLAKDIKEVLESLQVGQVYLLGHSLGGYVTLSLVEHFPEKVKGFGLIHSTANPDSEEAKIGRTNSANLIKKEGIEPFIDNLVPKLFSDSSFIQLKADIDKVKDIGYLTDSQAAQQTLLAMKNRPDRNSVLSQNQIPILLVAGSEDKIISADKTFSVKGDHIYQREILSAGHMSMYERPQELVEIIREFLEIHKN
jgi:3-oxoadipate enol-lactonase